MGVIEEVAAERRRQMEAEGWTPEHDDEHNKGQMASAAACYALNTARPLPTTVDTAGARLPTMFWPWNGHWWKPRDKRRDLIRAAALLVAEVERLDRATARQSAAA